MPTSSRRERRLTECHEAAHDIFAAINRSAGDELLSLDLTMGQLKAMATLTSHGPRPVGELGRLLGISEPAASLLVDRLEDRGLAARERDAEDRRRTMVTATPAAEELALRLRQGRNDQVIEWMAALTDDELDGLTSGFRALLRVAAAAQAEPHSPPAGAEVRHG